AAQSASKIAGEFSSAVTEYNKKPLGERAKQIAKDAEQFYKTPLAERAKQMGDSMVPNGDLSTAAGWARDATALEIWGGLAAGAIGAGFKGAPSESPVVDAASREGTPPSEAPGPSAKPSGGGLFEGAGSKLQQHVVSPIQSMMGQAPSIGGDSA